MTRRISDLSLRELRHIVATVRNILWADQLQGEDELYLNPEKEWDAETVEQIAGVLVQHGLRPSEEVRLVHAR